MEQMGEGLAAHRLTGAEVILPHFLGLLVEAFAKAGQVEEGLRVLDEALAVVHRNGEKYYLAELYRIKGELLLLQATERRFSQAAAEECFHQSIKIARQQKANSWELRAVMSLARLYQDQHKRVEAHGLLERIYGNFTEGFETADLREAKALLDELSGASVDASTT